MPWVEISFALTGVVGLLYGLMERAKRQGIQRQADTTSQRLSEFMSALAEEKLAHIDTQKRYERLIADFKAKLAQLKKEYDAALPASALGDRLNDLLRWRVPSPSDGPGSPGGHSK